MILGGLWTHNNSLNMDSYSVITTASPAGFQHIHHRAPVIIDPEHVSAWINGKWSEARQFITPYKGSITAIEIDPAVNNIRNNGPELLEPATARLI